MTPDELVAAMGCSRERAVLFAEPLTDAAKRFGIDSAPRLAAWLGQISHESGRLSVLVENLNYSASRLAAVWPARFRDPATGGPNATAKRIAGNPEAIANHVYSNRFGNGSPQTGHGWLYRGRGLGQITFHDNYLACEKGLGLPLVKTPEYLEVPEHAASSAAFWFANRIPLALADNQDIRKISILWNGGSNGMEERLAATQRALGVLNA